MFIHDNQYDTVRYDRKRLTCAVKLKVSKLNLPHGTNNNKQVAQLLQRDRATHELLRFAKLRSGIFEPPFRGLRGNVDVSCVRRWKKRGRLPTGDNWTL